MNLFPFYVSFSDSHEIDDFCDKFQQGMKNNSHISFFKKEKVQSYELGLHEDTSSYIGLFYDQTVPKDVIQAIQSIDIEQPNYFKKIDKIISIYHQHHLLVQNVEKKNLSKNPIVNTKPQKM